MVVRSFSVMSSRHRPCRSARILHVIVVVVFTDGVCRASKNGTIVTTGISRISGTIRAFVRSTGCVGLVRWAVPTNFKFAAEREVSIENWWADPTLLGTTELRGDSARHPFPSVITLFSISVFWERTCDQFTEFEFRSVKSSLKEIGVEIVFRLRTRPLASRVYPGCALKIVVSEHIREQRRRLNG